MSLQLLSWPAFALGALAIAGGLFLLQRLRVRHRPLQVVTTMFWNEAVEESRARVLVQRFRHPWAYALILLIALLLWGAFAAPRVAGEGDRDYVVLLDASAAMEEGGRLGRAIGRLEADVARLPRDQRRVMLVGARTSTVLAPGEDLTLLEARTRGLKADACPSRVGEVLRERARLATRPTTFLVADAVTLREGDLEGLPDTVEVQRLALGGEPGSVRSPGLTALGAAPARSGAFDRVDVYIEWQRRQAVGIDGLRVDIDGATFDGETAYEHAGGVESVTLTDVPARGQRIEVAIAGKEPTSAGRAALILPERRRLRVRVGADLPEALGLLLAADPAFEVTDAADVDLVVCRGNDPFGAGLPRFELRPRESQSATIEIRHEADHDSRDLLLRSFRDLGLDQIDAVEIAEQAQAPVEVTARAADVRGISVWAELFDDRYDFLDSRAFPLFVASALRWMAGIEEFPARVAVGEAVRPAPASTVFETEDGATVATAGGELRPTAPGLWRNAAGGELLVSYLAPRATKDVVEAPVREEAETPGEEIDLVTVLLLGAFVLLLIEWFLFSHGRVP